MKRTRKMIVASLSIGMVLVIASAWFLYHDRVSAQDEKPYSASLNSPLTFPVDI
ncbi:MAG: hypothetical protein OXD44_08920 [Gammaproteobacteria bacterium]|nr:hypothetical protein [Gammaproteobacteria bacterium]MCY4227007.1 hypothetical protein [Gammaproteobacteria bacterium]MCY4313796.1 hypothetical protein [Gammaproteobacteria bacterium]